ncbi:MAG: peptidase T [Bacteroidota bacterium]
MDLLKNIQQGVTERFLRYVQIDTQSDPQSTTIPSTAKQKDLGRLLLTELQELGIEASMDDYGYVVGRLPSNAGPSLPVLCFCAHLDTSPDCSGANVKPKIHPPYDGGDLFLDEQHQHCLNTMHAPDLLQQMGNTIITSDGSTLLGADDKAGVAEIMEAAKQLVLNPKWKHGPLVFLFTVDEEIGRGVDHLDLKALGADWAYTLDGEERGDIEDETFSADSLTLHVHGISAHPGFAKGRMVNALKVAGTILHAASTHAVAPEHTEGREGFVHPVSMEGNAEHCRMFWILRDFQTSVLDTMASLVEDFARSAVAQFPGSRYELVREQQYRNMKETLDQYPFLVDHAAEAMSRAGVQPRRRSIRGGTDGSRLTAMGLPCPNLFAGGHHFHSRTEWVSVEDMGAAVMTIMHLASLFAEEPHYRITEELHHRNP